MTRPFTFKIHAAEFFAEVQSLHPKQHSRFLIQLATDLITLNPTLSYSEKVISETIGFIEKQREHGKKGGRPLKTEPKGSVKAALRQPKGSPNPKEEVKEEKNTYSERVTMTSEELHKLQTKYGEVFTQNCINKLSAAKCANDKLVYTSDYHAILKWVVESVEKSHPSKPKFVPSLGDLI